MERIDREAEGGIFFGDADRVKAADGFDAVDDAVIEILKGEGKGSNGTMKDAFEVFFIHPNFVSDMVIVTTSKMGMGQGMAGDFMALVELDGLGQGQPFDGSTFVIPNEIVEAAIEVEGAFDAMAV